MSPVLDVTADLPKPSALLPLRGLTPEEVAPLAEELAAYAQHFAPFFYRREQRDWAAVYLRGLLTADVRRRECRSDGSAPDGRRAACRTASAGLATVRWRGQLGR